LKHSEFKYRCKIFIPAILGLLLLISCEKKVDTIKKADILTLPSVTGKNIGTIFTDSGKVQLVLSAPLIETYSNTDEPYSEFRFGLNITFYEGHKEPVASATAKYARYTEKKKLWELKDSVVVVNEANEKLETEQLFWDEDKDLIFTDRFVKITREEQTIVGTGFESDSRLLSPEIKKVTATIYLKNE
jgi:LPS export ABC transporter protein LptC